MRTLLDRAIRVEHVRKKQNVMRSSRNRKKQWENNFGVACPRNAATCVAKLPEQEKTMGEQFLRCLAPQCCNLRCEAPGAGKNNGGIVFVTPCPAMLQSCPAMLRSSCEYLCIILHFTRSCYSIMLIDHVTRSV